MAGPGEHVAVVVTDPFHDIDDAIAFVMLSQQLKTKVINHVKFKNKFTSRKYHCIHL